MIVQIRRPPSTQTPTVTAMYPATVLVVSNYGTASATTMTINFTYDDNNKVISQEIVGGESYAYSYNDKGLLSKEVKTYKNESYTTTDTYDSQNRLLNLITNGTTTVNSWDSEGRPTSYYNSYEIYTITYNTNGSLNTSTYISGGTTTHTESYEYLNDTSKHSPWEVIWQIIFDPLDNSMKYLSTKVTHGSDVTSISWDSFNEYGWATSYTFIKPADIGTTTNKFYITYK